MFEAIDPVRQAGVALLRLLVAGLLGGLIGVERERAHGKETFAGVRTFPLISLMGGALVLLSGEVGTAVVAGFLAVAAVAVAAYIRSTTTGDLGSTTEVAALATYWIGVAAGGGALLMAGFVGIVTVVLLASKERLEAFPRALTREEIQAALTLAVIAAIVLPVLPDRSYGPWGVWNPRQLWSIVVIVSGLSFAAFIGMRLWGRRRGLYVSGLLGGLISSTAVTVSFASRSREHPGHALPLAVSAGLASLVMFVRIGILTLIVGPGVLRYLGPFLAAALAGGGVATVALARRAHQTGDEGPGITNPFHLSEAVRFALLFAAVLLAVAAANRYFGSWGVLVAAALAGLTDVDAITVALAGTAGATQGVPTAAAAIALAALSNTVSKAVYAAWFGAAAFRRALFVLLGAVFAAGLATLLVTRMLVGAA